jgi:hypothetical protein
VSRACRIRTAAGSLKHELSRVRTSRSATTSYWMAGRVVGKSARGPNNLLSNSSSCYPRSGPDPLEWTIPSPSEGNATAKQGYQRRAPIACSLLPSACTLTHAFPGCPTRTQRISHGHRSSIIARHRMSCRWSTPQRKVVRATDETRRKSRSTGRSNKLRSGLACGRYGDISAMAAITVSTLDSFGVNNFSSVSPNSDR